MLHVDTNTRVKDRILRGLSTYALPAKTAHDTAAISSC